jgi:hypothetical protein
MIERRLDFLAGNPARPLGAPRIVSKDSLRTSLPVFAEISA